jgi:hypothetical protein
MDGRRAAAGIFGMSLATMLLVVPPDTERSSLGGVVIENRAVVIDAQTEVALGMPVDELGARFAYDAYDAERRAGLVQWIGPDGASVVAHASDGVIRAISVAFDEHFRTSAGVGVGDPAWRIGRTYGRSLRDGNRLSRGDTYTSFEVACTGRVNAIGVALGAEGLGVLRSFWSLDAADPCGLD